MGFYRLFFSGPLIRKTASLSLVLFFPLLLASLLSAEIDGPLIQMNKDTLSHLNHNDVKMGERLFYGLIREQTGMNSCVSCHNIHPSAEFNWNPSAFDIASSSNSKSVEDLKHTLQRPVGKRLALAHTGFENLNDKQLQELKSFLQHYYEQGGYKHRAVINRLLMFLMLTAIFILALLDLIWFRVIRFRVVHGIVLLVTALFLTKFTVEEALAVGRSKNFEPDQPVKFSHAVHAGQNQINCLYCHHSAEYGKSAGIPSASVCLNCHMIVREGNRSGRFEIDKIFTALEKKQPIEWTRVYDLPDHVFFSHAQHAGAGKIDCMTCHGNVKQMDRIVQVPDLSMGWCINCHRDTKVQFHDNQFYAKYENLRKDVQNGKLDSVTVAMVGGTDCMKCHY